MEKIPPGIYCDDPLGAFYNFRFGAYGPVEEGREYKIFSFPKKDTIPYIYLRIAKKDEFLSMKRDGMDADYLSYARIDKDLFGSQTGNVEIFFTRGMVPVEGVVKDIVFFGDIKGTLIRQENKLTSSGDR